MSIFQLLRKEIGHRKGNALLATAVVASVVALTVATIQLSDGYRRSTEQRVASLDDEIRKTMKELGFNVYILPRELNLSNFFAQDFGRETMSESLVEKLANSKDVFTINHLRPALVRKVTWPEQNRDIIMMGVRGVVPWSHRKNPKKPLAEAVPEGKINLGALLAKDIEAKPGDEVTLQGRSFSVGEIYPKRGNEDDITAWVDLAAIQEIAELPGQINMIQALNCNCASIDRLAEIEQEISGVLGDEVKVMELSTEAIARAQARVKVEESGKDNLRFLRRASLIALIGLATLGSVILGLMFLRNATQRTSEVGMLRAIGVTRKQILALFLGKALLVGFAGGCVGLIGGVLVSQYVVASYNEAFLAVPFAPIMTLLVPLAAAVISALATWIPIDLVTGKDPAQILREAS